MSPASRYIAGLSAALAGIAFGSAVAMAQTVPAPTPDTLSLSDSQKADLLSQNTESSVEAARAGLGSGAPGKAIHGEVGALVGTHGARSVFGTAAIPLGDHAGAVVSFESSHFGDRR